VIAYAFTKGHAFVKEPQGSIRRAILTSVAMVATTVLVLMVLTGAGREYLPVLVRNGRFTPVQAVLISLVWSLSFLTVAVLWLRRPRSVLDLWLIAVMCAWICDIALSGVLNAARFDLGFYAGRVYGLLAASFVLAAMLVETGSQQLRFSRELATERSEARSHRESFMSTQTALQREVEERLRIFDVSQDLILVTDTRGTFVQASPSSFSILGYRPEEMIGHSAVEFIYPDDLERTRQEMRRARRGRVMRNFVTRYLHKDGRVVALTWMGAWSEPVRRHFFVGRDMTEMLAAQEALVDSEQLARRIIDTAPDGFVLMDETGAILDWNSQAEKMFGWTREEAVGKKLAELIIPEAQQARYRVVLEELLRASDRVLATRLEIPALRRDGKGLTVELSVTAFERRGRRIMDCFIRDLTEKIADEAQLRQAQKMDAVGQLTGGIAHDFNNILTVILGTIEILAKGVADRPQLAEVVKLIDEAAEQGAGLNQHLLAFARKQPLQPREVDINDLIVTTAKLLRPTLGEQIEIETSLAKDTWLAFVDPHQLTTAILNLALNSRDAMPQGGKLILETQNSHLDASYAAGHSEVEPGAHVMIAVSDTGGGIPAHLVDKVFEPFFTTKEFGRGTGLGLSMVYGFVKQSGGHIKVYSEEGHGTTFRIYLPRSVEKGRDQLDTAPKERAVGGSELILVVEDDPLVRNYVVAQVRGLGYRTLSAANAEEALAVIQADATIDLLFTDVIMGGKMNGRQLAHEASRVRPGLKVLYTSGYTENAIVHHGRLDPGVLLLAKPYRQDDLARMIRQALSAQPVGG
jgi:PAS domain S-box-containing protein